MEQQRENREQMRERVIVAASKAFLEKGVKAVTMDHVARVLKMSKRTIYQLFKDKEALLLACYEKQHKQDQAMMERMAANAGNVLEALLEIFAYRMRTVGALRPSHFEGVSKYDSIYVFRRTTFEQDRQRAIAFMADGVKQGVFREGVDFDLVYVMIDNLITWVMTSEHFANNRIDCLFINSTLVVVRGICTQKGIDIIDRFLEEHRQGIA
ncbi:MAG: TetR/AcrR family transcriptional regulator [Alloprevotella sp.]